MSDKHSLRNLLLVFSDSSITIMKLQLAPIFIFLLLGVLIIIQESDGALMSKLKYQGKQDLTIGQRLGTSKSSESLTGRLFTIDNDDDVAVEPAARRRRSESDDATDNDKDGDLPKTDDDGDDDVPIPSSYRRRRPRNAHRNSLVNDRIFKSVRKLLIS